MAQLMPLVYGVLLPLVVSALILVVGRLLSPRMQPAVSLAAAVLAFVAAQIALTGRPELPPSEASQWLVWILPVLIPLGLVFTRLPNWAQVLGGLAGAYGSLYLGLRPMVQWTWESKAVAAAWLSGFVLLAAFMFAGLSALARTHASGRSPRFAVIGLLTAASIALAATGSLMLAQLAGAMAAALGPLALAKPQKIVFPQPLVYVVALLLAMLLAMGVCYSNLPLPLAGAFGLVGLAMMIPAHRSKRRAEP